MRMSKVLFGVPLILVLAACSNLPAPGELPSALANAKTADDHVRIANYYAQKAASYEAEAAIHDKMPYANVGRPRYDFAAMNAHCRELQVHLKAAAKEARGLEQAHRALITSIAP